MSISRTGTGSTLVVSRPNRPAVPVLVAATGMAGEAERYRTYQRLFDTFDVHQDGTISRLDLADRLCDTGFAADDSRVRDALAAVDGLGAHARSLTLEQFIQLGQANNGLIGRALRGDLIIPDFAGFANELIGIYEGLLDDQRGAVADYIPQLKNVDPDQLAIAVCTVDGQRFSIGQSRTGFCIQSICKPINYCLALEEHGPEFVHRHVGREPSGRNFNALSFDDQGLPHNPMINAGAIMVSSLMRPQADMAERFDFVTKAWNRLSGGERVGFNNAVYLSERQTADRNFALAYSMRESRAFPAGTNLIETLEFYFQCCSIEADAELVSVVAATLANGGVSPTVGGHVFSTSTVQRCLSLMSSCGMYDYSGEFAFEIGLPAKSGVSGALMIVIPKVMGICVWSPRLDRNGNSVRGIEFCRELVSRYNFHVFDGLVDNQTTGKRDPRVKPDHAVLADILTLCWAAGSGDLEKVRSLVQSGVDPNIGNYDRRTPLHLAASEGHADIVEYLLVHGVDPAPVDRWGGTPQSDAERAGHTGVVALLTSFALSALPTSSTSSALSTSSTPSAPLTSSTPSAPLTSSGPSGPVEPPGPDVPSGPSAPPGPPAPPALAQPEMAAEETGSTWSPPPAADRMTRKAFVIGYTRLLSEMCASGELARRLETEPAAVLAELGLPTVPGARVTIVRTLDADPDLEAQSAQWERGHATGRYMLYVPYLHVCSESADLAGTKGGRG